LILPIVQPTKSSFVINLKTAKALGPDLPLELDAVGTLSGHGFHPLKADSPCQSLSSTCPAPGAHSIFGDMGGKLDVLRVECTRCGRKGRYSIRKLIEKYGRKANMM
jgi:hypothetical protein